MMTCPSTTLVPVPAPSASTSVVSIRTGGVPGPLAWRHRPAGSVVANTFSHAASPGSEPESAVTSASAVGFALPPMAVNAQMARTAHERRFTA
ncbi:hypothetical protein A5685_21610 [Mycobacterium colombiense]|uniref:Uncharacterized protein n=1 Tax=Mycobacterium colombiense TaxID=339268 RepID=A0A1A2SHE8_9MYCO|nr:hypothetical protein A5685_21610 [Mycobacterium colombiense]